MPLPAEWDLSGKTAIITSDRRGWTSHLASALAEAGADVAVAGSPTSDLDQAVDAVEGQGRRALRIETDLTRSSDVASTVQEVVSEFGRLDILVNNARVEFGKPFVDVEEAEWDAVMDFNVRAVYLCCQHAGRQMLKQGGGRIVNVCSGLSARGLWNSAVACASQGAVRQLTSALGLEWARHDIRVNAIGAGWVSAGPDLTSAEARDAGQAGPGPLERYIPLRRSGHPTDLSGLLVFLSSEACDFMTGQTVFIDGGVLAHA